MYSTGKSTCVRIVLSRLPSHGPVWLLCSGQPVVDFEVLTSLPDWDSTPSLELVVRPGSYAAALAIAQANAVRELSWPQLHAHITMSVHHEDWLSQQAAVELQLRAAYAHDLEQNAEEAADVDGGASDPAAAASPARGRPGSAPNGAAVTLPEASNSSAAEENVGVEKTMAEESPSGKMLREQLRYLQHPAPHHPPPPLTPF
jgi:hypothetical protein